MNYNIETVQIISFLYTKFEDTSKTKILCADENGIYTPITNPHIDSKLLFKSLNPCKYENIKNIYITPDSIVPRIKLQQLKEKYGFNVIRDYEKADHIIIGEKCINKHKRFFGVSLLTHKKKLIDLFKSHGVHSELKIVYDNVNHPDCAEIIALSYNVVSQISKVYYLNNITNTHNDLNIYNKKIYQLWRVDSDFEKVLKIASYDNLILDSEFIKDSGEVILNIENYLFISNLLSTQTYENAELALTMMATCNFEKSLPYLALLYIKHNHNFCNYAKLTNSINYKSLVHSIHDTFTHSVSLDNVVGYMQINNLINDDIKSIYKKHIEEHFYNNIPNFKNIKIKTEISI